MKNFKELRKEIQHHLKNVELDEIHAPGTKVRVPHKGKAVPGKVVRHDKGDKHGSPFYVVDVGEYESPKVPAHQVRTEEVEQIDEVKLVNIMRHPEHGKAYIWHKGGEGGYNYEVEHTKSKKKEAHKKSHEDVVAGLKKQGYKMHEEVEQIGEENKSTNVEEGAVPADPKDVVTLRHRTSGKEIRVVRGAVDDHEKHGWAKVEPHKEKPHKEDVEHIIETRRMSAAAKLSRAFDRLKSRHEAAKTHEQEMREKGREEFEKNHPEHAKKPVGEETESVAEGFDDHKAIAQELIKRHGKNVNSGHIKDFADERDTHQPLDHNAVKGHIDKILKAQKSWKKVTGWKKVKSGSPMRRASSLAQKGMQNQAEKKPVKEEMSRKAQIVKEAASAAKKKKKKSNDTFQDEPIIGKSEVRM